MHMHKRLLALLAIPVVIGLTACSGGSKKANADTATKAPPAAAAAASSDTLTVTSSAGAVDKGFKEKSLSAPANKALTINFQNDDPGIPHNVQIFKGDKATGTPIFAPTGAGVMVTGPGAFVYNVPALPAGTYTYNCTIHPTTMIAALTVA